MQYTAILLKKVLAHHFLSVIWWISIDKSLTLHHENVQWTQEICGSALRNKPTLIAPQLLQNFCLFLHVLHRTRVRHLARWSLTGAILKRHSSKLKPRREHLQTLRTQCSFKSEMSIHMCLLIYFQRYNSIIHQQKAIHPNWKTCQVWATIKSTNSYELWVLST